MMEKIDITNAVIAEEIRKQMAMATISAKGLMSPAMFEILKNIAAPVNNVNIRGPLTSQSNRFVVFVSDYIPGIVPYASWFFGFSIRPGGDEREMQYLFDFTGRIYKRLYSNEEWGTASIISV